MHESARAGSSASPCNERDRRNGALPDLHDRVSRKRVCPRSTKPRPGMAWLAPARTLAVDASQGSGHFRARGLGRRSRRSSLGRYVRMEDVHRRIRAAAFGRFLDAERVKQGLYELRYTGPKKWRATDVD